MSTKKTATKPVRWYAPDEKTLKRLMALGAPKQHIFHGWSKTEHWERVKMRAGESLGVVDGLRAFGKTKRPVKQAVAHFHAQGATIVDIESGEDSRTHGIAMLDDIERAAKPSAAYLAQLEEERREAWRQKHRVMPKEKAYTIWRHPTMKVYEKLDLMHGWTKDVAYREFGHTGRPAGRPLKKSKE
jgi:hypothetical protein